MVKVNSLREFSGVNSKIGYFIWAFRDGEHESEELESALLESFGQKIPKPLCTMQELHIVEYKVEIAN